MNPIEQKHNPECPVNTENQCLDNLAGRECAYPERHQCSCPPTPVEGMVEVETHYSVDTGKVKKVYANGIEVPFVQDGAGVSFSPTPDVGEEWEEEFEKMRKAGGQLIVSSEALKAFIRTQIALAEKRGEAKSKERHSKRCCGGVLRECDCVCHKRIEEAEARGRESVVAIVEKLQRPDKNSNEHNQNSPTGGCLRPNDDCESCSINETLDSLLQSLFPNQKTP